MLRKIALAFAATAALATAALAPTSASAWTWWDGPGWYSWGSRYYYYPAHSFADTVAYCARRYHSYDPASGTFLGNDGARHYCP
jgi:hypothetical protein